MNYVFPNIFISHFLFLWLSKIDVDVPTNWIIFRKVLSRSGCGLYVFVSLGSPCLRSPS